MPSTYTRRLYITALLHYLIETLGQHQHIRSPPKDTSQPRGRFPTTPSVITATSDIVLSKECNCFSSALKEAFPLIISIIAANEASHFTVINEDIDEYVGDWAVNSSTYSRHRQCSQHRPEIHYFSCFVAGLHQWSELVVDTLARRTLATAASSRPYLHNCPHRAIDCP